MYWSWLMEMQVHFLRGVGAIALGYPQNPDIEAAERKENYIVRIKNKKVLTKRFSMFIVCVN